MKKVLVLFILAICTLGAFAQVPQAFKYQAVIRDASDNLIANQSVDIRITIANSVPTDVYSETHTVTTSLFGLVSLNVGEGTPVTGTFNTIDWSADTYTIGVEVDAGSGYEDLGSSDLLSVPYALYSENGLPTGLVNETVRHDGSAWISDDFVKNTGTGMWINMPYNPSYETKSTLAIVNDSNAMATGLNDDAHLALRLINSSQVNNKGVGIGFSNSGEYSTVGAKIVFERTGGFSVGDLCFFTKASFTSGDQTLERMRITSDGFVGIGTTDPICDLDIAQSGGAGTSQGTGGIGLISSVSSSRVWRVYNSDSYIRFNYSSDGGVSYTPKAYVSDSDGSWNQLSDMSLKHNIEPLNAVLDKVMDIEVLKYNYIDNPEGAMKVMGVSANATQKIFPEIVSSEEGNTLVGIDYSKFGVISIKAIQEQQVIIEDQQQQINDLQQQIDELRQLIEDK